MSELGSVASVGETLEPGVVAALTAGQIVRNAREAAGLHVAALAVSMKIPVKKLEALESDRLELLHDAVFVRALASSVCRTLKIDPVPVLSRLPGTMTPRLNPDDRGINAPFRTPGDVARMSIATLLSKPAFLIVGALLVGAVVVAFYPDITWSDAPIEVSANAEVAAAPTLAMKSNANRNDGSVNTVITSETTAQSTLQVASSVTAVVEKTEPALIVPASEAAPSATITAPASTGLVVFKARGTSWVKVVDANGVVQLSKTLTEGETVSASGATPLSVVVGRVDATDVEVRGKAFNLAGLARENVARFEVK